MMRACPGLSPTLPTAAPLAARPHQSIPHEVFLPSVSPHNMTSGTCMHSVTMGQDMALQQCSLLDNYSVTLHVLQVLVPRMTQLVAGH